MPKVKRTGAPWRTFVVLQMAMFVMAAFEANGQNAVHLTAVHDNTLYESATGSLSNGSGSFLFAGRTNLASIRRAVIKFDLPGDLPGGSVVDSVRISLNLSRTSGGVTVIKAHRLLADWGEGTSDAAANEGQGAPPMAGDATWMHTFFDTSVWSTPGGDFDPVPSGEAVVDQPGVVSWPSSPELVGDVQRWLDTPSQNFGWVFVGDEETSGSTKRFDSRENVASPNPPTLTVYYSTPTGVEFAGMPTSPDLIQTYPNPFRRSTTVEVRLSAPQAVVVRVYDLAGRQVRQLYPGWSDSGRIRLRLDAQGLSAGSYFVRIHTAESVLTTRVTLLR